MLGKYLIHTGVTSILFALMPVSANAASTGWVNAHQLEREARKIVKSKSLPVSIFCKAGTTIGQSRKNTMLKVEYRPNLQKLKWRWAWGDRVAVTDRKYVKKGYKKISSRSFVRASGLRIKCALWHK